MVGFLIAVLSGVLMSVQGIFNTQVTKASSIWSANVFVQATALLSCLAVWLAADRSNLFAVFRSEPKYLLLGGVLGAGITWTVIKAMAMLGPARARIITLPIPPLQSILSGLGKTLRTETLPVSRLIWPLNVAIRPFSPYIEPSLS